MGSYILETLSASPVSEMYDLLLLLGATLVTSRQPRHWRDAAGPLEAMLAAVSAMCSVRAAVPAASLHCNMCHCNNSEIHGIFSGAAGTSLSTCQCCCFGDSSYIPWGRRLWSRQALVTCAHCPITPHCDVGTRGSAVRWPIPASFSPHPLARDPPQPG